MTLRRAAVIGAFLTAIAGTTALAAADLTPDAAYTLVVRKPMARGPLPKADELAAARKVLEEQAARNPETARWTYALAHVAYAEAQQTKGDAAKAKRKEALERFERAAELQPGDADGQVWLGDASFEHLDDVGMLSKMSLASQGRKAFEKAIALDSNQVAARLGLAQFYLGAPGIAGGSVAKATEQAEALLALPEKRGEFQGHMMLGAIAVHESHWDDMSRHLTAAETAPGEGADPVTAFRSHISYLLNKKKDAASARAVADRYLKIAAPDDFSALYFDGEVKRLLGQCADALVRYDQVLAHFADARGSRWGAAVCHEQLGQKEAARRDYEEYARRFPEDARAKEAKEAVKRLSGS